MMERVGDRPSDGPRPLLIRGRPILAVFEICLRCNSACGYCDLPLNVGRYEMTRDEIRKVFAGTVDAKTRNLKPGHFSFNVAGGRCDHCDGEGYLTIDMQLWLTC